MKKWFGFEKWFDFSHQHTLGGKFKNWLLVFAIDFLWATIMSGILLFAAHFDKIRLTKLLGELIGEKLFYANLLQSASGQAAGPAAQFFFVCIIAPLWEEVVFRVWPLLFALLLVKLYAAQHKTAPDAGEAVNGMAPRFLFWTCCFTSIIFGIAHGSIVNLLFQGVSGLLFSWLYLANNRSYWSAVAAHGLWNFMVIFGLRVWIL